MRISLTHKILLVVAIPLAIQLIFLSLITSNLSKLAEAQNSSEHFVTTVMAKNRLIINEQQRAMLMTMYLSTMDPNCRQQISVIRADASTIFKNLATLWKGDSERITALDRLWDMNRRRELMTQGAFENVGQKRTLTELLGGFRNNRTFLEHFMTLKKVPFIDPYFVQDQKQKEMEDELVDSRIKLIKMLQYGGLAALLLSSFVSGLLFSFSVSRRLKIVLSNISALADNQTNFVEMKGSDEISRLNSAVVSTAIKIREAEEFQAQTIAIFAEELNKPLIEVEAALQELPTTGFETLSEKGAKRLHDSQSEVKRLGALVFELVNLETTGRKPNVSQFDLSEMVTRCLRIVEPLTKLKSISVAVKSGSNTLVFADSDKTTQVLVNLLSNAIKYSPEKSTIEIDITSSKQVSTLSVRDHGPGIPEEFQSRIFQRFEQAEPAAGAKAASSGLGLKISKEIIESQNGQIGFSSARGDGTTFWFSLPVSESAGKNASNGHPLVLEGQGWKSTLWKKALLIVALPIVVQLATIFALYNFLHQNSENIAELQKVPTMTALYEKLMTGISRAGLYSMLYNVDRLPGDLKTARAERTGLRSNIVELEKLTAGDSATNNLTQKLFAMINAHIAFDEHVINAKQDANVTTFIGENGTDKKEGLLIDVVRPLQDLLSHQNQLIATNVLASEGLRHNLETLLFASAIAASCVATALALLIGRSLTTRTTRLANIALRLSDHRELPAPTAGGDELAFVEQQLHSAGKKLMELEILRAEMIGITSHELRTPLTSLIALIEVMEAGVFGDVTENGRKLLAKARLETSELIVLITNLLDLEKMESGRVLVTKQRIKIEGVFEQIKADNKLPADNREIDLQVQDTEQELMGDSSRLSQALTAVIRSIIERIPTKSKVSVGCKTNQYYVILTVGAPHGVAGSGYLNKHRELAREHMAISLARLTAQQHGGDLELTTSNRGRVIELRLPIGA